MNKPIGYIETSRINFGDLDPYGHLNAKHYLDIVASARLRFLESRFGFSAHAITERGCAWFLKESSIKYKRPINGLVDVLVDVLCHSRVIRYEDGVLEITFEIKSFNGETEHATGVLVYSTVDTKTGRRCTPAPWMNELFFETPSSESYLPQGRGK